MSTAAPDRAHGAAGGGDGTPETCGAPAGLGYGTTLPLVQKAAATLWFEVIVTVQPAIPLHAPPHPPKLQPPAGVWLRPTCVPAVKLALQVAGQLIPEGELVTVPGPSSDTESVVAPAGANENTTPALFELPPW